MASHGIESQNIQTDYNLSKKQQQRNCDVEARKTAVRGTVSVPVKAHFTDNQRVSKAKGV